MKSKIGGKLRMVLAMLGISFAAVLMLTNFAGGEDAADRKTEIERLRKELADRPNNPDNITIEYRLAVLIKQSNQGTDLQTHQIVTDEARQIYERVVNNYNHMDYYSDEPPNHPRSPQVLVPECAVRAGIYQKDKKKAREYYHKAIECLNQTCQRRKKDWETASSPKKPSLPFGGQLEMSKWEGRMFMWRKRRWDASEGNVLNEIELQLMRRAVKRCLLSYLAGCGSENHISVNLLHDRIRKAKMKIIEDFPDTPIADYASECGDIILSVLNSGRVRIE